MSYNGKIGGFIGAYSRLCPALGHRLCTTDPDCHAMTIDLKDNKIVRAFIECSWCHTDAGDVTYDDVMSLLHYWSCDLGDTDTCEIIYNELIKIYGEPKTPIAWERDSDDNIIAVTYEGEEE